MNHVTEALAGFIRDNESQIGTSGLSIQSVLAEVNQDIQAVYDFEPNILQVDDFPCICLGDIELTRKEWVAAPYVIQSQYAVPIIAYLVYDDRTQAVMSRAIKRLAKAIERLFEDKRNEEIPIIPEPNQELFIGDATHLHYNGEPPIVGMKVQFAEAGDGNFLCRAELSWVGYEVRQIADGQEGY